MSEDEESSSTTTVIPHSPHVSPFPLAPPGGVSVSLPAHSLTWPASQPVRIPGVPCVLLGFWWPNNTVYLTAAAASTYDGGGGCYEDDGG